MTKEQAVRVIIEKVREIEEFKFTFIKAFTDEDEIINIDRLDSVHLISEVPFLGEIQTQLNFYSKSFECRAYPSPVRVLEKQKDKIILFLNEVNNYIKKGRVFLDDERNIVYASCITNYAVFEKFPDLWIHDSIILGLRIYKDIAYPLNCLLEERAGLAEACTYLEKIWQ